ncbi:MAG: DUF58 domain-containing protein [Planctomycetes bacterium]|nr:DUF58 domain-containing protein [Planctomycetota bacterium]
MTTYRRFIDPETIGRLKGLELKAKTIVEGYVSGLHKSPYHGFSVEFAEHREYVPGDDLRYVDWKVYGKSDRIYLKQYDEETNFTCHILLDTSESMAYRSDSSSLSKLDYAKLLAASIAYIIVHQQDSVGLATFSDSVGTILRPGSTASHLSQFCEVLEKNSPMRDTAIGPVLHDLAERIKRRGLVILLSDLFDDPASLLMGLKHFRHRRHDVVVMQVIDGAEQDFPFREPTLFKGLEGLGDRLTHPKSLRVTYQQEFTRFLTDIQRGARDLHMDYVLLRTDQPFEVALHEFLARRMH